MQQYKCIIVEDEPLAAEVLQDYIRQVPFLKLIKTCSDAIYAMETLKEEKIDLVFLDIHLPKLKGLDFIKSLTNPPHIIITSAYHEYALEGHELNVLDYLLKPIEFKRFLKAVNRLSAVQEHTEDVSQKPSEREYLFFNVSKKKVKIFLDEILYIESLKEYIRVCTRQKTIITKFQLGEIEEILSKNNFLRVHRSFIVAKDKIDAFTATDVEVSGKQLPIGRSYKDAVQTALDNKSAL
ncbi:MAG TPA: response regulator transcription factor [Ferruginibacter sp.]|nr:response regulator transcription factor [Ferruginibacter sp.]HMX80314.1 response regulator transcription factor [Ferruginibacter sp.]HNA17135.1 response regulator transcription factor [Ferruginibacter sp.]HNF02703.1 response regulator transcription factor [Ferruginibacter sp.]